MQKKPASHTAHGPPGGPKKPGPQMQLVRAVAGGAAGSLGFTSGETVTVMAGHDVHAWLPMVSLNLPSPHGTHIELLLV